MDDHNGVREKGMGLHGKILKALGLAIYNNVLIFSKIFAEDVNFFNYWRVDYLAAACRTSDIHKPYPYAYPPRFVLKVSARNAKHAGTIELTFIGAERNIYAEIVLSPTRCEFSWFFVPCYKTLIFIILIIFKVKMIWMQHCLHYKVKVLTVTIHRDQ